MKYIFSTKSRLVSTFFLTIGVVLLGLTLFTNPLRSASPVSGTLGPAGPNVVWDGTALGGSSPEGEATCTPATCDAFSLTLDPTANWAGKKARITVSWTGAGDDYDVYIHKGPVTGPLVASSAAGGAGPEVLELDPSQPAIGTGAFTVNVVYWLVVPPAVQYHAVASAVGAPTPTPTPTPGGSVTPTPTPQPPGTPRFANHYAPPGFLEDAGEPTNGVNWLTENNPRGIANAFRNKNRATGANNPIIGNGGTSLYYGGINNYFLRATFDDCSSPALVQWDQIPLTTANATRVFYDPILYTDHWTGRTFVCQEVGLTPGGSTIEYTDDDGENMLPSEGAAPSGGVDHQTIGGGRFHAPLPPGLIYPNATGYASQNVGSATFQLSLDGGITFPIQTAMFTAADCAGLHGHLKWAEDGTIYLPDKACEEAGVPFVFGGHPSVVVSENNGATWDVRPVLAADSDAGVDDASVGVSWCPPGACADAANRSNHIYLGFMYTDGRPGVAYSNNKGLNWVRVTDLGAQTGIKHIAFPAVAVGDPDRAVFTFFGTLQSGNYSAPEFDGIWHLYAATTFDFGQTWTVQNISPEGPIQRKGICGDGTCRNLLDFFDVQIDKQGRILIAGEDGCIGGCEVGGANSFTAKAFISRQTGGRRMFKGFGPETPAGVLLEPVLPGAPQVSATIDAGDISLTWPVPDSGGSPITSYKVYRAATQAGPFNNASLIATVTQPNYLDTNPTAPTNFYVVTAINAQGEGPYCKEIQAVADAASPCELPGILVSNDLLQSGADDDAGANTPVDPRVNIKQLFVAEPFIGGGTEQIFFTLQVLPSTMGSAPPNSQWFIVWNRQTPDANHDRAYVAMRTDALGAPTFEYGRFGVPLALPPDPPNPNSNTPVKIGDADEGSSYNPLTGVIRIVISNSKLRAFDGGAAKYQAGSVLGATNVRTYFNRLDPGQRSQNNASDISPDGTYTLVGNVSCAPDLVSFIDAFSRKTHGSAGTFDVRLGPPVPPLNQVAIEPRRGDGAGLNTHHVVFVFAQPVTFSGATVTPGAGGTTGSVTTTPAAGPASEVTVNFTATNRQTVTVNLLNVSAGGTPNPVSVPVGLLLGDVNASRVVTGSDVNLTKAQQSKPVENENFRSDINASGVITGSDVNLIKGKQSTSLP